MNNKSKLLRRLIALCGILLLSAGTAGLGLFSLQMINGKEYRAQSERRQSVSSTVVASRGEILDRYGRPLVTNKTVFSLTIEYAYWKKEAQNETLRSLVQLIQADGSAVEDSLPISQQPPFAFTGEADSKERSALQSFAKKKTELQETMSADEMIAAMRQLYAIDSAWSDADARAVIGVRYEMENMLFSRYNPFTIATDVSLDLISKVKEQHQQYAGVEVATESVREYKTTYAAHLLGRVGKIYAEDWDEYKEKGYSKNALVGRDGLEKTLESYLHGTNGTKSIETDITGDVTDESAGDAPQPGNNCILTIDLALQEATEDALAETIESIPTANAGAAVVIQVGTGEVLAMASYPTYQLKTFNQDYEQMYNDPNLPMLNRAIGGTYAPGSTYKPLTAIAALQEGTITEDTYFTCNMYYNFFTGQTFRCTGSHGRINVVTAIQKSCNIFFYNTGRLLGGEKLEKWAAQFGFGQKTDIELAGERAGSIAGPTNRAAMLEANPSLNPWMPGDNVQAAIGQSDNAFTPLQIANYVATIAAGGEHYQPTLLKSVKSYDYASTIKQNESILLNTVDIDPENLELVKEGMNKVVSEDGTAAAAFAGFPIKIGGKTGTAQVSSGDVPTNGLFVAFAPYDNPEIAVCVVGEGGGHGSTVAPAVRKIMETYFASENTTENVQADYTLLQ